MKNRFNKIKYNVKRLKPRPEDIELNKCTHEIFDKETGECPVCGVIVSPDTNFNDNDLLLAAQNVIDHLESMKMIANACMSKKEIKAAQKYFDMIPLLQNVDVLLDICKEELNNTDLDIVDLYEPIDHFDYDELNDIVDDSEDKDSE